jgi:neutral trehalase
MMKLVKLVKILLLILFLFPSFICGDIQYGAFDPAYWNGLVILENDTAFAFRFVIHKGTDTADGYDTFHIIERVGPFAPDGTYAEVSFNPTLPFHKGHDTPILKKNTPPSKLVKIRCSKFQKGVVGCISIPKNIEIETLFYNPWQPTVNFRKENNSIIGENSGLIFRFKPVDSLFETVETKEKTVSARVEKKVRLFYFYAGLNNPTLTGQKVEKILKKSLEKYSTHRPKITGQWEGLIASITNNLSWMKLYQPDKKRIYLPAGRRWIFPKPDGTRDEWTIFEWDAFFNALEAAVEDKKLAKKEIEAVLDTQYPNGNIPNWRSAHGGAPDRSQPPVGSFAVLKTYYRFNDISILKNSYAALKKWHQSWKAPGINGNPRRDGNEDGLLEWGSDTDKLFEGMPKWEKGVSGRQRAAWESGEDDLPNYDNVPFDEHTCTLKMNCIDLSSLYALDTEMMGKIATILGKKEDAKKYKKEYETIQEKINQQLWNRNFYFDRSWNGTFSTHKAASNFYPLVAGIPDEDRVDKLMGHLLSKKEFWGDYVIPTISRDNPAFKDQQYWRGTIWPPTNYLVYQGLKRYRLDKMASEFAIKSASLFLESWQTYGLCRENYNSITGEGGGQRYQSWGPLFALILLEDFIDISPFDGFRVGNLSAAGKNKIKNIHRQGNVYTLEADNQGLLLYRSKTSKQLEKLFELKGKAVLRFIEVSDDTVKFEAHVISGVMDFYPLLFSGKHFYVTSEGKKAVKMKDFIRIPQGSTKIVVIKESHGRTRTDTDKRKKNG